MSEEKTRVPVDAHALCAVLQALNGPPHHIREMQATMSLPVSMCPDHPIRTLVTEFNTWFAERSQSSQESKP